MSLIINHCLIEKQNSLVEGEYISTHVYMFNRRRFFAMAIEEKVIHGIQKKSLYGKKQEQSYNQL